VTTAIQQQALRTEMTSSASFRQFSLENQMQDVTQDNTAMDAIYKHDTQQQKKLLETKPWANE
jgi:hypothetical protein